MAPGGGQYGPQGGWAYGGQQVHDYSPPDFIAIPGDDDAEVEEESNANDVHPAGMQTKAHAVDSGRSRSPSPRARGLSRSARDRSPSDRQLDAKVGRSRSNDADVDAQGRRYDDRRSRSRPDRSDGRDQRGSNSRERYRRGSRSNSRERDRQRRRSHSRDRDRERERQRDDTGYGPSRRDRDAACAIDEPYHQYDRSGEGASRRQYKRLGAEYEEGLDGQAGPSGQRRSASDDGNGGNARRNRREHPSTTVHVRNIPDDKGEEDLQKLFSGFPGVKAIRLVRNRLESGPPHKGYAFVDFNTLADAEVLMGTKARYGLLLGGQTLKVEYTQSLNPATAATSMLDWVCDMCSAVNFARRLECYQCSSSRPANPQRVNPDQEGPTAVLKVSNLQPHVTEDDLTLLFSSYVSVKGVRVVLDKFTGLPRGVAFVEMYSVAEASRALGALQGASLPGNVLPLRLCYAKDKFANTGGGGAGDSSFDAAQAMEQYTAWEPTAFNPSAVEADAATAGWEPKGFDPAAIDGATDTATTSQAQQQPQQPDVSGSGEAGPQSGFVFDPASGYYYDAASGYYYDAKTGLYYHPSTNVWYMYDHATGQYTDASAAAASSAATPAVASAGVHSAGAAAHVGNFARHAAATAPAVRRGAVIGAAPVLNAQGLLAAAALAEEKTKALQKAQQKHKQAPGKQPAGMAAAARPALGRGLPMQQPAHGAAAAGSTAAVQGVIHRGKWSQRNQQMTG